MEGHQPRLWYCNLGFDLGLGGMPTDHLADIIAQGALLIAPGLPADDAMLLEHPFDKGHTAYLAAAGLELPQTACPGERYPSYQGAAWGWDDDAVARLGAVGCQLDYPPLVSEAGTAWRGNFGPGPASAQRYTTRGPEGRAERPVQHENQ